MLALGGLAGIVVVGVWLPQSGGQPPGGQPSGVGWRTVPEGTLGALGQGTAKVKPDTMRVSFGVHSAGPTYQAAAEDNDKKIKKVQEALAALKVPGLEVKVGPAQVQVVHPEKSPPAAGPTGAPRVGPAPAAPEHKPEQTSYHVTHSFSVTARGKDLDVLLRHANEVVGAAVNNGTSAGDTPPPAQSGIGGGFPGGFPGGVSPAPGFQVELFKEDMAEARSEAMTKAVANALENARAAAGAAKLAILDTVSVTDQTPVYNFYGGNGSQRTEATGETEISVTVNVTCRCEHRGH
jgi:uncharacterized protein YggE